FQYPTEINSPIVASTGFDNGSTIRKNTVRSCAPSIWRDCALYPLLLLYTLLARNYRLLFSRFPYYSGICKIQCKGRSAMSDKRDVINQGPFFHDTRAELRSGNLLEPQHLSDYQNKKSNYIHFTATLDAAKGGAELAAASS